MALSTGWKGKQNYEKGCIRILPMFYKPSTRLRFNCNITNVDNKS